MGKIVKILVLTAFLFSSCSESKLDKVIQSYDYMYGAYIEEDYDTFYESLNQKSKDFITELTSIYPNRFSFEKVLGIGKKYHLQHTLVKYFIQNKSKILETDGKILFYRFLGINSIALFNFEQIYEPYTEKTQLGKENYLAITALMWGKYKKINWAKFSKENGENKYDLLYTLQLNEAIIKYDNKYIKNTNPKMSDDEYFDKFYNQVLDADAYIINDRAVNRKIQRKKTKYHELKHQASFLEKTIDFLIHPPNFGS